MTLDVVTVQTELARRLLNSYGSHSLAFQTLQKGIRHHFVGDCGFLAYASSGSTDFVLSDPVCSLSNMELVIDSFLSVARNPVFVQVHEATARVLENRHFASTPFGIETELSLPYALKGGAKADVRNLNNAAIRAGVEVTELLENDRRLILNSGLAAGISSNGRQRFMHGLSFLARLADPDIDIDTRFFGGFCNGQLVGVSAFDPMYDSGAVVGYAEVVPLRTINSPKGTRVRVLLEAMQQFAREDVALVNLGLSPFYRRSTAGLSNREAGPISHRDGIAGRLFDGVYRYGSIAFNFEGLALHKRRFRGYETTVYYVSRSSIPVLQLVRLYRLITSGRVP
ncbi:MAG: phosphatidylglycerol lysyltransferase domain-containing protein [Candidatus Zixiibacteriota bacterium]